jgi:uncharacterized protein (DUF488 family)
VTPTVYTVGHGTRGIEELVGLLHEAGVMNLVDVRRFPGSRRHPQFARAALEEALPRAGIAYHHLGDDLGGRRRASKGPSRHPAWRVAAFRAYADHMDTDAFNDALAHLESLARGQTTAIMCAETLWWKCHRRLISDALALHGFEVVHLIGERDRQQHRIHPAARLDEFGRVVYDKGHTASLL